jgi:hypothetical protein
MMKTERRRYRRLKLSKPCKLFDPRSAKYASGRTCDLSSHGMLINLDQSVGLRPGDPISVGIVLDDRHVVIGAKEMAEGEVVRSVRTDQHTLVAVRFPESRYDDKSALATAA